VVIDGAKVREGEERGDGDGEKRAVTAMRMRQRRATVDLPSVWVGGRLCHLVKLDRFGGRGGAFCYSTRANTEVRGRILQLSK
jgi:hypothetical protein